MLITAITNEHAFLVGNASCARFRVVTVTHRVVFPPSFETNRQTTRRIDLSKQNFRQRRPALLPWIPGFNNRWYTIYPSAHVDAAPRCNYNYRLLVRSQHLLDQLILAWR